MALGGESEEIVGDGLGTGSMKNVSALEVPPPGVGLKTVIWAVPEIATFAAGTAACNWPVVLLRVVRSAMPFHCTTEVEITCKAVTDIVNDALPCWTCSGEMPESCGVGLKPFPFEPQPRTAKPKAAANIPKTHLESFKPILPRMRLQFTNVLRKPKL